MRAALYLLVSQVFLMNGVRAASTVPAGAEFAWGANIGWLDARAGDGLHGAVFRTTYASGRFWSASTGWISLGDGSPANGRFYANDSASDYGVNHVGGGALRGLAWSPNLGWVLFEDVGNPRVDIVTGVLSGRAWAPNAGWIDLSGVLTDSPTSPVAGDDLVLRSAGRMEVRVPLRKLLENDQDPEGRELSFEGVSEESTLGGSVALDGAWIVYTAPSLDAGGDAFTYVVRAGFGPGGAATGTVSVQSEADGGVVGATLSLENTPEGGWRLVASALPGRRAMVQTTVDLRPGATWTDLELIRADPQGRLEFDLPTSAEDVQRFYRLVAP